MVTHRTTASVSALVVALLAGLLLSGVAASTAQAASWYDVDHLRTGPSDSAAVAANDGVLAAIVDDQLLVWEHTSSGYESLPTPAPTPDDRRLRSVAVDGRSVATVSLDRATDPDGDDEPVPVAEQLVHIHRWTDDAVVSRTASLGDLPTDASPGRALAFDAGIIAVGVPGDDTTGVDDGAVHLLVPDGDAYDRRVITSPDLEGRPAFGSSVALRHGLLVVGAPRTRTFGTPGFVAVYEIDSDGSVHHLDTLVPPPDRTEAAAFGTAVSTDGRSIGVANAGGSATGSAHLFLPTEGGYHGTTLLAPPEPDEIGYFPVSIAVEGRTLVAGSARYSNVFVFDVDDAGAVSVTSPIPPDRFDNTTYGRSVAIDSGVVTASGAHPDDGPAVAVYTPATQPPDTTPPTITVRRSSTTRWSRQPVGLSYRCTDDVAVAACPADEVVGTEGTTTLTRTAVDTSGNETTVDVTVRVDRTAPTIDATTDPATPASGWHRSPVRIDWTATDELSGLSTGATGSTTITADGVHDSWSTTFCDNAFNCANAVRTIRVDQLAPSLDVEISPAANDLGWHRSTVSVRADCADSGSGVESCPTVPAVDAEGTHDLRLAAQDVAGNSTVEAVAINIDRTPPTVTAGPSRPPTPSGWHHSPVDVEFECADAGAGLRYCPRLQGITDSGIHEVGGTAVDRADNLASATVTVRMDRDTPSLTFDDSLLVGSPAGTAGDETSGVARVVITYRPSSTPLPTETRDADLACDPARTSCRWSAPPPTLPGAYDVLAQVQDVAGRLSTRSRTGIVFGV